MPVMVTAGGARVTIWVGVKVSSTRPGVLVMVGVKVEVGTPGGRTVTVPSGVTVITTSGGAFVAVAVLVAVG